MVNQHKNSSDACILTGDLNTTPYEPLYRDIKSNWVNAFDQVGEGSAATFPNTHRSSPFLTLDYVFIKGAVTPVSAKVLPAGSSDHLSLLAKVKI